MNALVVVMMKKYTNMNIMENAIKIVLMEYCQIIYVNAN